TGAGASAPQAARVPSRCPARLPSTREGASVYLAFASNGARAGKDTAAHYAESWFRDRHVQAERWAFAYPAKQLTAEVLGLSSVSEVDEMKVDGEVVTHTGNSATQLGG